MFVFTASFISLLIAIVAKECHRQVINYGSWTERLDRLGM
jgi:hypothetical protein